MVDTNSLLQAALEYAGYGWRVLPIRPASKLPLLKAWQKNASANPAQIESWWAQNPTANVGVALGEGSNLIDVECDSDEAEEQLVKLFGDNAPSTATYRGQRGRHRLFLWQADLPPTAVIHLGKIEIRTGGGGKGAQSVFPPSIHPSGIAYQWLVPPTECKPIPLPTAIWAALWNLSGDDLTPPEEWRNGGGGKSPAERAALYVDRIDSAGEGNRNQQCYKVACVLLRDFALPESDAAPILAAYNARCTPPLDAKELAHTIQSAQKYGLGVRGSKLQKQGVWEPDAIPKPTSFNTADADVLNEACSIWNEQFKLHGEHCFDNAEVQKAVYERLWSWVKTKCERPVTDECLLAQNVEGMNFVRKSARKIQEKYGPSLTSLGLEHRNGEWWPGAWRVETINCDPPEARLYAPFLPKSFITMLLEDFDSPHSVHLAVLAATRKVCLEDRPGAWAAIWNGQHGNKKEGIMPTIGMKAKLLRDAKLIEAPPEVKRENTLAIFLWSQLAKTQPLGYIENGQPKKPMATAKSFWRNDSLWFSFEAVRKALDFSPDKLTRNELSNLCENLGVIRKYTTVEVTSFENGKAAKTNQRAWFMVLETPSVTRLKQMAGCEQSEEGGES